MRSELLLLTLLLFLALAAGSAWADEAPVDSSEETSQPSNIEGWDVDPKVEEDKDWILRYGLRIPPSDQRARTLPAPRLLS